MKMGRLKKAYLSSFAAGLYQIVSVVCSLIVPRLILIEYGSVYNGAISSITQFLDFISVLQIGIQGATRVALYKAFANNDHDSVSGIIKANQKYYRLVSYFLILYIIVLSGILPFIISEEISRYDVFWLVIIIGFSNFLQYFFGNVYKALLSADQASYIISVFETITLLLSTLMISILIINGNSILLAKFGSSLIYSLNPIALFLFVNRKYKFNKNAMENRDALKNRWDVLANSAANIIHEKVDVFFITLFCNTKEVSVYAVYNLVSMGIIKCINVIISGTEAAFGDMWAKKERELLKQNFKKYEFTVFAITSVLVSCTQALIIPFVSIYTSGITDVEYIRPIFSFVIVVALATYCIRLPYVTLVQAAGFYKETKIGSYVEAFLNFTLTFVLVIRQGITGAVIATAFANVFRSLQYGFFTYSNIIQVKYYEMVKRVLWLLGTMIVSMVCDQILLGNIIISAWMNWIISAGAVFVLNVMVAIISSLLFYRDDLMMMMKRIKRG